MRIVHWHNSMHNYVTVYHHLNHGENLVPCYAPVYGLCSPELYSINYCCDLPEHICMSCMHIIIVVCMYCVFVL